MHNSDHVNVSLDKIRTIFERASARIEALKPGEKIPATALAVELGAEFGLTGPQLYPTLRFLFDGYPGIIVRRGAHGGLIKPDPSQSSKKTSKKNVTDTVEPKAAVAKAETSSDEADSDLDDLHSDEDLSDDIHE